MMIFTSILIFSAFPADDAPAPPPPVKMPAFERPLVEARTQKGVCQEYSYEITSDVVQDVAIPRRAHTRSIDLSLNYGRSRVDLPEGLFKLQEDEDVIAIQPQCNSAGMFAIRLYLTSHQSLGRARMKDIIISPSEPPTILESSEEDPAELLRELP